MRSASRRLWRRCGNDPRNATCRSNSSYPAWLRYAKSCSPHAPINGGRQCRERGLRRTERAAKSGVAMQVCHSPVGGHAMPKSRKPLVVVTRKLPDRIEVRMRELFDTRLNSEDRPLSQADLIDAVKAADVLVPTVTDRIDAAV